MPRWVAGIALALVLVVAGCGRTPEPEPAPAVPAELVGAWSTVTDRGSAFSYEFSAAGTYVYVGIMRDGTQQYTLQESGTVQVGDGQLTLRPDSVTVTRSDPAAPADDYRSSPARPPRTLGWTVSGGELTVVEDDRPTVYRRE